MLSKFSIAEVALFNIPFFFSIAVAFAFCSQSVAQMTPHAAADPTAASANATDDPLLNQKPWRMTGRIHLEKGTNKGYLVLQLDMRKGYYTYSVNPKASPAPTTITLAPSADVRMLSKFESDKAPKVIEKDPVFQQRIEKHLGKVQFFAQIEVRPGVDVEKLVSELQFKGQICSQESCQPIRGKKVSAKFAGHFEMPAKSKSTASRTETGAASSNATTKR